MTPETRQASVGYFRRPLASPGGPPPSGGQSPVREAGAPVRSGEAVRSAWPEAEAAPARQRDAVAWTPPASPQPTAGARRAAEEGSILAVIPYLAVLACTVVGVYVAWDQGSTGGGKGGVVCGAALLAAALARLVLPARLVGLLGTRKRAIDVLTLTAFGGGLLVAGLVLPR